MALCGEEDGSAVQRWLQRRHTLYAAVYVACTCVRELDMAWQQEAQPYLGNRRREEGALEASINSSIPPSLPFPPRLADSELSSLFARLHSVFAHSHQTLLGPFEVAEPLR
jgi:hypothetical protein